MKIDKVFNSLIFISRVIIFHLSQFTKPTISCYLCIFGHYNLQTTIKYLEYYFIVASKIYIVNRCNEKFVKFSLAIDNKRKQSNLVDGPTLAH